jgi:8-oxo-dGTP pyrophosphatase MutT (NUDIX family)
MREIAEETGYIDCVLDCVLDHEIHAEYYAAHKDVNRYSKERCAVYHLISDAKHDQPLDDANHDFLWIPKADMADFLAKVP